MRFLVLALLLGLALPVIMARQPMAQEVFSPAAVVNDEVVSQRDLEGRLRIAMLASGLPETEESYDQITGPVLRQMIDERIRLQEAKRLSIEVSPEEIDQGLAEMAERNDMSADQFVSFLRSNNAPVSAIREQLRATLAWNKVLRARVVPQAQVTEEEIDQAATRMAAEENQERVRLAEIFLPYSGSSQEQEADQLARQLIEQLREGANFQQLAAQFSQAPTAASGGDTGFMAEAQLPPDLLEVVRTMRRGELAGPIETVNGLYIIAVIDRQAGGGPQGDTGSVRLTQILYEASDAEAEAVARQAQQATAEINSCEEANALAASAGASGSGDMGEVSLADMPQELRRLARDLPVGEASSPIRTPEGIMILFVCERNASSGEIDRNFVAENLRRERIDMLSARYMRDLRRAANIDIRL